MAEDEAEVEVEVEDDANDGTLSRCMLHLKKLQLALKALHLNAHRFIRRLSSFLASFGNPTSNK